MSQQFRTVTTNAGRNAVREALTQGKTVKLSHMSVGDGGGNPVTPLSTMTKLVNERFRAQINDIVLDPATPDLFTAELFIPQAEGGWYIREVGLWMDDGTLFAVGNTPLTEKPDISSGAATDLLVRLIIRLLDAATVSIEIDPAQVLAAFDAGIGDFAGIWPMWLYIGMERGNKLIYQPGDVNAVLTLTLVGDKAFCDAHPDIVVKFLRVWLRGVNMIKKEIKNPKLAEQYHRFWTEWAGQDIEPQMAKMDLEYHPVFDIDQQLAIFDDSKGPSQVEQWQDKVLDFFASQGRFSPEEVKKIRGSGYINGTFLKMAAESIKEKPLGDYKLD